MSPILSLVIFLINLVANFVPFLILLKGDLPTFDAEQQIIKEPASAKQDSVSMKSKDNGNYQGAGEESPPRKKPKVVDVSINGDSFDQTTGDYEISCIPIPKEDLTFLQNTIYSMHNFDKGGCEELFTKMHCVL